MAETRPPPAATRSSPLHHLPRSKNRVLPLQGCTRGRSMPGIDADVNCFAGRRVLLAAAVACTAALLLLSARRRIAFTDSLLPDQSQLPPWPVREDKLLGGLLPDGFDEAECRSRYRYARRPRSGALPPPSVHLLHRLRLHEALQQRCGPGTEAYRAAIRRLSTGADGIVRSGDGDDCKYLVTIGYQGLGNRMLAVVSAFLYSLLTGRVLLVDLTDGGTDQLFCEPFLNATWLLPPYFPISRFSMHLLNRRSSESYGNMLQRGVFADADGLLSPNATKAAPPYVYLHNGGDYGYHDKLFYCDDDQRVLQRFRWLLLRADNYFVPGLFLLPAFREDLARLFPDRTAAAHLLSNYLFHPRNDVWDMVTAYYDSHLAAAGETLGIQVRIHTLYKPPFQTAVDQILACTQGSQLLPPATADSGNSTTSRAVLVTSLSPSYGEKLRALYGNSSGIRVHQPSHDSRQRSGDERHNKQALAEIYLLSMCDHLVTTGGSTFGYVAHSLGGLKPLILAQGWDAGAGTAEAACHLTPTMEPCFHSPTWYDCRAKKDVDSGAVLPYIRRCEDVDWGLKIYE